MEPMPDVAILKNTQGWFAQNPDKPFLEDKKTKGQT